MKEARKPITSKRSNPHNLKKFVRDDSAHQKQFGGYTFELGLVLLGISLFTVGIFDVARLLQGRNAVRAGVDEAVRCLVTASSPDNCRTPRGYGGTVQLQNRVDVFSAGYQLPYSSVSAFARWSEVPRYAATVVEYPSANYRVEYDLTQQRLGQQSIRFPLNAISEYLLETTPPVYLTGTSFSPDLRSLRNRQQRIGVPTTEVSSGLPEQIVTGAILRGINTDAEEYSLRFLIGSASFQVNGMDAASRNTFSELRARGITPSCFQPRSYNPTSSIVPSSALQASNDGTVIDWSQSGSIEGCSVQSASIRNGSAQLLTDASILVPVAFQVTGGAAVSAPGTEGKVSIAAEWIGADGVLVRRNLGGRVFNTPILRASESGSRRALRALMNRESPSGTLVMRGVPKENLSQELFNEYQSEYSDHGAPLLVPDGSTVTLKFYMRKTIGTPTSLVGWSGKSIKVYHPKYTAVRQGLYQTVEDTPNTCRKTDAQLKIEGYGHLSSAPLTRCELDLQRGPIVDTSEQKTCEQVPYGEKRIVENNPTERVANIWQSAQNDPLSITSKQSFLVLAEVCASLRKQAQCPPNRFVKRFEGCEVEMAKELSSNFCDLEIPHHAQNTRIIPLSQERVVFTTVEFDACNLPKDLPPCATLTEIPDKARTLLPGEDPAQCRGVTQRSAVADPYKLPTPMTRTQCEENIPSEIEKLRSRNRFPIGSTISLNCSDPEWSFVPEEPKEEGVPYRKTPEGALHKIAANVSSNYADALCASRSEKCEKRAQPKKEVVIQANNGNSPYGGINQQKAAEVLYETVQTFYPRAEPCTPQQLGGTQGGGTWSCTCDPTAKNCLQVSISEQPADGRINVDASIQVPQIMLSTLSDKLEVIQHRREGVPEERIIR